MKSLGFSSSTYGLLLAITGAYVTNLAPERFRGRYHGMWVLMWSFGMVMGPALGTMMFERNPAALWVTCAAMGLFGAALALIRR